MPATRIHVTDLTPFLVYAVTPSSHGSPLSAFFLSSSGANNKLATVRASDRPMESLGSAAAIASPSLGFLRSNAPLRRSAGARMCFSSGKDENSANSFPGPSQIKLEGHKMDTIEESLSPSKKGLEVNNSDILKLFNDAQRNIIYLNNQRLMAMEELNKLQRENQFLLERIKTLEGGNIAGVVTGTATESAQSSSFCELLLRIDAMVLSGKISNKEASVLRKKVMDNKNDVHNTFNDIQQKNDTELLSDLRQFSERTIRKAFHIVHICSEMEPIASFGSSASYVAGLSYSLQRKGNLVEVILPKYASIDLASIRGLRKTEAEFDSYFGGRWHRNRVWTCNVKGIGVTLIEPLYHSTFFNRDRIYGYADDFERFCYFSRASMDYLVKSGKKPDMLHIHNWQTAIIGPLFWDIFVHQGLGSTRILFTCHDLGSQCLEQPDKLELCGLDPAQLYRLDRLQDNSKTNLVNIVKGGIVYSNKVIIMSSIHSKDRIISSLGHGLEPTLAIHKEKILISPYGFDGMNWDPSKDKLLPAKYSAENIEGKAVCKVALRHRVGFSGHSFAIIGGIYPQVSGIDMDNLRGAVLHALRKGSQFVFMGAKDPVTNTAWRRFQDELKDVNVRFIDHHDEALLHLILAGSDIILCSSFHDPASQIPLKAIKYGSAPISINMRNGLRQSGAHGHELGSTKLSQYILSTFANMSLSQALDEIRNDPSRWTRRIKDGMSRDFSWDAECCHIHWAAYESIKNL